MKIIKYQFLSAEINHGTEEEPNIEQVLLDKVIECETQAQLDANYPIAGKEAYQGKVDVTGEFEPVPVAEPTADEILNAMLGVNRYA